MGQMGRGKPFARLHYVMAAMATMLANQSAHALQGLQGDLLRKQAFDAVGGYESNSKTGSRPHDNGGTKAFQRKAMKRRNQLKNRRAHR